MPEMPSKLEFRDDVEEPSEKYRLSCKENHIHTKGSNLLYPSLYLGVKKTGRSDPVAKCESSLTTEKATDLPQLVRRHTLCESVRKLR